MYTFMNKDKIIGRFAIINGSIGRSYHFEQEKDSILPVGFSDMGKWLENRKASKHNAHLKRLMRDCGCEEPEVSANAGARKGKIFIFISAAALVPEIQAWSHDGARF